LRQFHAIISCKYFPSKPGIIVSFKVVHFFLGNIHHSSLSCAHLLEENTISLKKRREREEQKMSLKKVFSLHVSMPN